MSCPPATLRDAPLVPAQRRGLARVGHPVGPVVRGSSHQTHQAYEPARARRAVRRYVRFTHVPGRRCVLEGSYQHNPDRSPVCDAWGAGPTPCPLRIGGSRRSGPSACLRGGAAARDLGAHLRVALGQEALWKAGIRGEDGLERLDLVKRKTVWASSEPTQNANTHSLSLFTVLRSPASSSASRKARMHRIDALNCLTP